MMYGLNDIASSDALFPKAYVKIMERANGLEDKDLLSYFYPQYFFRLTGNHLSDKGLAIAAGEMGVKWLARNNFTIETMAVGGSEIPYASIRALKRIFFLEAYDFRIGLWASLSSLIMVCVFWILGRRNVKKA
jgi:hypothetical protein